MKVAVVKTGPGVTCPIAIASINCWSVSQPFEYGPDIYIVKILERTEPQPLAFEQVKEAIRAELEARQHEQLDAEVAAGLLREADATVYDQVIQRMLEEDQAKLQENEQSCP